MGVRPRVHRAELARAITRIAARRARIDDVHRDRLPDSPDSDPREVLDYLQKYSGKDIPRWVRQADVCDALTLNNWLWWEDRRRELHFLTAGKGLGLYLSQLGAQVGVGKQGVVDRMDRLEALLRYDRPDEKLSRTARREARSAQERRPAEDRWIAEHRDELKRVIEELVAQADRHQLADEERDFIDELARDGREDDITPATMSLLNLAVAELRTAAPVLKLLGELLADDKHRRPYRVHAVLVHADDLRSDFAAIGVEHQRQKGVGRTA